jgi:hypothetical protein
LLRKLVEIANQVRLVVVATFNRDCCPRRITVLNRAKHLLKPDDARQQFGTNPDLTEKAPLQLTAANAGTRGKLVHGYNTAAIDDGPREVNQLGVVFAFNKPFTKVRIGLSYSSVESPDALTSGRQLSFEPPGKASEIHDTIGELVGGRRQKAVRAAGLKTNTQQLNRAARRDEDRPSHLADKKVSWLNLPLTVNVLKKLIAKVQDQLNTPVRQNPLRRRSHPSAAFHPAF